MCVRGESVLYSVQVRLTYYTSFVPFDVILPAVPNQIPLPPMIMQLDSTHVCTLVTDLPPLYRLNREGALAEELQEMFWRYGPVS